MQNAVFQTLLNVLMAEVAVLTWIKLVLMVRQLRRQEVPRLGDGLPPG